LVHAQQALALSRQRGTWGDMAIALTCSGRHHARLGNFDMARAYCLQALDLTHQLADPGAMSLAWEGLGVAHYAAHELDQAIASFKQAVDALPDVGPRSVLPRAEILAKLGDAYDAAGDRRAAAQAWRGALRIYDSLRHPDADYVRAKLLQS
jgi:tetratricopeptide (TPR) repeat protein